MVSGKCLKNLSQKVPLMLTKLSFEILHVVKRVFDLSWYEKKTLQTKTIPYWIWFQSNTLHVLMFTPHFFYFYLFNFICILISSIKCFKIFKSIGIWDSSYLDIIQSIFLSPLVYCRHHSHEHNPLLSKWNEL